MTFRFNNNDNNNNIQYLALAVYVKGEIKYFVCKEESNLLASEVFELMEGKGMKVCDARYCLNSVTDAGIVRKNGLSWGNTSF